MTYIQTYHGVAQCLILHFFKFEKKYGIDFPLDLDKGIRHALHYTKLNFRKKHVKSSRLFLPLRPYDLFMM